MVGCSPVVEAVRWYEAQIRRSRSSSRCEVAVRASSTTPLGRLSKYLRNRGSFLISSRNSGIHRCRRE
eukprot:10952399-Alexandrium_andersonii.AAC.1